MNTKNTKNFKDFKDFKDLKDLKGFPEDIYVSSYKRTTSGYTKYNLDSVLENEYLDHGVYRDTKNKNFIRLSAIYAQTLNEFGYINKLGKWIFINPLEYFKWAEMNKADHLKGSQYYKELQAFIEKYPEEFL